MLTRSVGDEAEVKMSASGRVLVLDGDQAAALAVVRSLARQGLRVDVADCVEAPLSAVSKHCFESFRYADPKLDPEAFVADMLRRVAAVDYELVIPVTDDTMQPLAQAREQFTGVTLAVPPDEPLRATIEKDLTRAAAERVGVPCPQTVVVHDAAELAAAAEAVGYPAVLKPARSVTMGEGDARATLSVRYAHGPDELARASEALKYGPVLVQERCAGRGVGVEVLVDQGEVLYAFQHERHHEWPLTGGGSSLRESVRVDDVLLEDSRKLLREIGFHGVAMVEFKVAQNGDRRLMEINGRFWGSLPLCTAAGADFPKMLYRLLVHGERPTDAPARTGVYCRKLSREAFWLIEVLRRTDPDPTIVWPSRLGAVLEQVRGLLPNHHFDVQSLRDMQPGWLDVRRTVAEVRRRFTERRARQRVAAAQEALRARPEAAAACVKSVRSVLFLCYGNINRSLVAGRLAGSWGVAVDAAGFHPREGRPADSTMKDVAAERGLDLEGASSRRVTAEMVAAADCILVMEAAHLLRLREEHPNIHDKVMLLGVFDGDTARPVEIADPYGGDRSDYEHCFDRVTDCVRNLGDVLGESDAR